MLFKIVELFLVLANLSVVLAGAPPACLLACVSKEVKNSNQFTLNQQPEICHVLGDKIVSCFSSTCPNNGANDAKTYFENICGTKFNSTFSSSSSSSSTSGSSSGSSSTTVVSSSSSASATMTTVSSAGATTKSSAQSVASTTKSAASNTVAAEATSKTESAIASINSKNAAGSINTEFSGKQFVILSVAMVAAMSFL